jgi:adenylate kinase
MYVILLGPPGAGKGTQAGAIVEATGMAHVASGDLFRAALRDGTELGMRAKSYMDKGELVPDEIVIGMIMERISQPDCQKGVLFDGFPRTPEQAKALEEELARQNSSIDAVIYIDVPDEMLIKRISGRIMHKESGAVYNIYFNPPPGVENAADHPDYYQRPDDNEETVKKRLEVYHSQTAPLIEYYRSQGRLREIDGNQEMGAVNEAVMQALGLSAQS